MNILKDIIKLLLLQDDYYKDQSHLSMVERTKTNYDHPFAFDTDLLVNHLQLLKHNISIEKPIYDFALHTRSCYVEKIEPRDVILLEGIFVLAEEKLRNMCDILVYVDTDSDIRFMRRLKRDMQERGRSLDSVNSIFTLLDQCMNNLKNHQKNMHI